MARNFNKFFKTINPIFMKRKPLYKKELVSKRFSLFKVKEGDNFNRRNTFSISRIKI